MIPTTTSNNSAILALLHLCHVRSYPAKTTFIRPGDLGDCLHFIIEGSVSICAEDGDGHELILAYVNKNEFIGEIGIFKGAETRQVTVRTRTPCKLAEIGYSRLHHALKNELAEQANDLLHLFGEQ